MIRRRLASGTARVWCLSAAIGLAAVAMVPWAARLEPLPGASFRIPWWALVPLFYAAERAVVHFSFNRHAHSFSLSEIPLVLGLYFSAPLAVIVGQATGNLLALTLHRRQSPQKLAFNVVQFTLQAIVVLVLFRALADPADPLGLASALGALVGVTAALLLANLLINAAIRLSGGRMTRSDMVQVLSLGGAAAGMNTTLALVAVNVAWSQPTSLWVGLVPPIILFVAYRSQVTQRQEHARLSVMYEATRELHRTPKLDEAVVAGARRALAMFGAEEARIALVQEAAEDEVFVTTVSGRGERVMELGDMASLHPAAAEALATGESALARMRSDRRHDAMAVPLRNGEDVIGAFVVLDPESDIAAFSRSDLNLLETLASQLAVSLENGRLEESLAALHDLKEELRHQAEHDPLTGLANRALFHRRVEEAVAANDGRNAILFLDLDDFKRVNDTMGHAAGDELLRLVGERIEACCRARDTVARLGGDEFAVLLTALAEPGREADVARRLLDSLSRPFDIAGVAISIRASVGVARMSHTDSTETVLAHADQAMYVAKGRRKGSFHIHGGASEGADHRRVVLRSDMQSALVAGELALKYQPIVELETGRVIGAEALLRWVHPVYGAVPAPEALSVAAEGGLMGLLGAWTVGQACRDMAELRRRGLDMWVSVNISGDQLEPALVETLTSALDVNGLDASSLVIEITERTAIDHDDDVLAAIHALGVRIAVDDFGTGYSSLARLDSLPIAIVKVDRTFVARMVGPERSRFAEMVLEIGETLGLMTVAEGIETESERRHLVELGCAVGQGWLFSRAVDVDEIAAAVSVG